jgi:hypothetical protein
VSLFEGQPLAKSIYRRDRRIGEIVFEDLEIRNDSGTDYVAFGGAALRAAADRAAAERPPGLSNSQRQRPSKFPSDPTWPIVS